jgi:predicted enzyme related to lactoylglutathione lyase
MPYAIVHFEIPADDVARAQQFYKQAFGWKISDPHNMGYWFVETRKQGEEGINGGLMQRKMPGQPFMNYIAVKSVEAALARVTKAGGTVCMPKTDLGQNMGSIAAFQDTEGNMMGFYQEPKVAKAPAAKKAAKKTAKKK